MREAQEKVSISNFREAFSSYFPSPTSKARQFVRGNPTRTEERFLPFIFAAQDKEPNDLLDVSNEQDCECLPPGLQVLLQGHSCPLHTHSNGVLHPQREDVLANILSTGE